MGNKLKSIMTEGFNWSAWNSEFPSTEDEGCNTWTEVSNTQDDSGRYLTVNKQLVRDTKLAKEEIDALKEDVSFEHHEKIESPYHATKDKVSHVSHECPICKERHL